MSLQQLSQGKLQERIQGGIGAEGARMLSFVRVRGLSTNLPLQIYILPTVLTLWRSGEFVDSPRTSPVKPPKGFSSRQPGPGSAIVNRLDFAWGAQTDGHQTRESGLNGSDRRLKGRERMCGFTWGYCNRSKIKHTFEIFGVQVARSE